LPILGPVNPDEDIDRPGPLPGDSTDYLPVRRTGFILDPKPRDRQGDGSNDRSDEEPLKCVVASPSHDNRQGDTNREPCSEPYQQDLTVQSEAMLVLSRAPAARAESSEQGRR
jgi:hypothetical protein